MKLPTYVVLPLAALIIGSITGCAGAVGSALVVGQTHSPIPEWNSVAIVTNMPEGAEEIAIVKASSGAGPTQQDSLDYAIEELKKQAAKVGANVVVLSSMSTQSEVIGVPVNGGGTIIGPVRREAIEGLAVYFER